MEKTTAQAFLRDEKLHEKTVCKDVIAGIIMAIIYPALIIAALQLRK